jgi:hypothetical protein
MLAAVQSAEMPEEDERDRSRFPERPNPARRTGRVTQFDVA